MWYLFLFLFVLLHSAIVYGFRGHNAPDKSDSLLEQVVAEFDFGLEAVDTWIDGGQKVFDKIEQIPLHARQFDHVMRQKFPAGNPGKVDKHAMVSLTSDMSRAVVAHDYNYGESRELVTGHRGKPYDNGDDKYKPNNNVKNGAAMTPEDFSIESSYYGASLVSPILLFCLGFAALFFFNIALCCRCCCKCCQCKPNDHHSEKGHEGDSHDTREKYVNDQKRMVLIIEFTLIFAVFLADSLCFYGYTHLETGVKKLNEAFDMLLKILADVMEQTEAIGTTDVVGMKAANLAAQDSCSRGRSALLQIDTIADTLKSAVDSADNYVDLYHGYIEIGQGYVRDYGSTYLRPAVFVIWSFAALSTFLFVLFRVCSNECGTKFAIFWGELTFIIILAINLPLMVLTSILGDFCVQPTASVLRAFNGTALDSVVYSITHCDGSYKLKENLQSANSSIQDIANWIEQLVSLGCGENDDVKAIKTNMQMAGNRVGLAGEAVACENIQAVWFKLMNEALCGGFYDGIYSLWVSQFITSLFLFFLIICASISYQYFKPNSQIVVDNEQIDGADVTKAELIEGGEKGEYVDEAQEAAMGAAMSMMTEGNGDIEMTDQDSAPVEQANDEII